MPIKRVNNKTTIKAWVNGQVDLFLMHIRQALHNVGLEAVTISRTQHRYTDQTGNLTSSIGYVIVDNGEIVGDNFQVSDKGTDKNTGLAAAQKLTKEIASEFKTGMQLIMVAGMPYAVYVEAMGLNVLDGAEIHATKEIKKKINDIIKLWQS